MYWKPDDHPERSRAQRPASLEKYPRKRTVSRTPEPAGAHPEAASNQWLLIKHCDTAVDPCWKIEDHDGSVVGGGEDSPGWLPGATARPIPTVVEPMLATPVQEPPSGQDWLFELKWDGMRGLALVQDGRCELRSRAGHHVTAQYPELAALPDRLRAREAVLDGEIVVLDGQGRADFVRLQTRMHVAKPSPALLKSAPVDYYLFDILYCDGYDLRGVALAERKSFLRRILDARPPVRFSDHLLGQGRELFELAARHGIEGIVGKQLDSRYLSGRGPQWVKVKVTRDLEAVIGGYTEPRGAREHFGALLLGLYRAGQLTFIGSVGSGFTQESQAAISGRLAKLETASCPFPEAPRRSEPAHWVRPELVARVKYAEWTPERRLRQPVFLELRDDLR